LFLDSKCPFQVSTKSSKKGSNSLAIVATKKEKEAVQLGFVHVQDKEMVVVGKFGYFVDF